MTVGELEALLGRPHSIQDEPGPGLSLQKSDSTDRIYVYMGNDGLRIEIVLGEGRAKAKEYLLQY